MKSNWSAGTRAVHPGGGGTDALTASKWSRRIFGNFTALSTGGKFLLVTWHLLHVENNDGPGVYSMERGHESEGDDDGVDNFHRAGKDGVVEQRCIRAEV